MNVIIVACILTAFASWEIVLLLHIIFGSREAAKRKVQFFEDKAIEIIFSMFSAYRGFKVRIVNHLGQELPERFIVVANHQSLLDIPIIMHIMPSGLKARFVAKQELAWGIPLISLLLRTSGHCLIKRRGDALQAVRIVTAMATRCMEEGTIPVIFPEGTRSRTGDLGAFHSAGYRKILEVEPLPILVIAVEGGWQVARLGDFFKSFGKTEYSASLLAVLPAPRNRKESLETLEKSRDLIEKSLEETRGRAAPEVVIEG
ncbi:MAG TPA: lysophospholipid acyltransferase family protein [Rectinemataceae bacterium]|nr:lysophospholipid acyltransferase family protein [Rectinemataceae bacterium]